MTTPEAPPMRVFGEGDGDLGDLAGRTIAFIGYGNQGRGQALNVRDSLRAAGLDDVRLLVGTLSDRSWQQAEEDGFTPQSVPEAAQAGDVLFFLIPDEVQPDVFAHDIAPHLNANDVLVVASGYNLMFGGIKPPAGVDVVLLAPRMIGRQMRQLYERGEGFYSYVGVEQDASGRAWPLVLALAKALGTLKLAALELSARDETVIDLLMEQGFGAMLGRLIFETLAAGLEAGLPAEAMVLELYLSGEMSETFQAMADLGFVEQSRLHSLTSQYGGMTRSMSLDREPIRRHLKEVLEDITSGGFAKRWAEEQAAGYPNLNQFREVAAKANPFTAVEERLHASIREANERAKPTE